MSDLWLAMYLPSMLERGDHRKPGLSALQTKSESTNHDILPGHPEIQAPPRYDDVFSAERRRARARRYRTIFVTASVGSLGVLPVAVWEHFFRVDAVLLDGLTVSQTVHAALLVIIQPAWATLIKKVTAQHVYIQEPSSLTLIKAIFEHILAFTTARNLFAALTMLLDSLASHHCCAIDFLLFIHAFTVLSFLTLMFRVEVLDNPYRLGSEPPIEYGRRSRAYEVVAKQLICGIATFFLWLTLPEVTRAFLNSDGNVQITCSMSIASLLFWFFGKSETSLRLTEEEPNELLA